MSIYTAKLPGAHFARQEYKPSRTPYIVWGGIGAVIIGVFAATAIETLTNDEPVVEKYRVTEADAYGIDGASDVELGKSLVTSLLMDEVRRAREVQDVPRCESAVGKIAVLSPGLALTIECGPTPQP